MSSLSILSSTALDSGEMPAKLCAYQLMNGSLFTTLKISLLGLFFAAQLGFGRTFDSVQLSRSLDPRPEWMSMLSSAEFGAFPPLKPARYTYIASWKGLVDAGEIQMEFQNPHLRKAGKYVVRATGKSLGMARSLYPYSASFWTELEENTMSPTLFIGQEEVKGKSVSHDIRFSEAGVNCFQVTKDHQEGNEYRTRYINPFYPISDIFSGILWVRSQQLNQGQVLHFLTMPGDTPYLMKTQVLGREKFNGRNAIRMSIAMQKVDTGTLALKEYKKMRRAEIWISDDAERALLEIRAAVFIGDVRISLKKTELF